MKRYYSYVLENESNEMFILGPNMKEFMIDFKNTFEGIKKILGLFSFSHGWVDVAENQDVNNRTHVLLTVWSDRKYVRVHVINGDIKVEIDDDVYFFDISPYYEKANAFSVARQDITLLCVRKKNNRGFIEQSFDNRDVKLCVFLDDKKFGIEMKTDCMTTFDFDLFSSLHREGDINDLLRLYNNVFSKFQNASDKNDLVVLSVSEVIDNEELLRDRYVLKAGIVIEYFLSERRGNTVLSVSSDTPNERKIVNYREFMNLTEMAVALDLRKRKLEEKYKQN